MINKLKSFAITMLATGATVAATTASATVLDTNTYTNLIQSLSISLTAYSNAVPNAQGTKTLPVKPVTITTKTILSALSNDSGNIPALVGFDFGKSPQLVVSMTFAATNTVSNTATVVSNFTVTLGTTNGQVIAFSPDTNSYPTNGPDVTITDTNGSAIITNNAVGTNGGTNVVSVTGDWSLAGGSSVSNNVFAYITNATGLTNVSGSFPTNVGVWTVITAATNGSGATNVTATTYTNVPSTLTNYVTNNIGIEVQGGTPTAPVYASLSGYVSKYVSHSSEISATGTALGTTNVMYNTYDYDGIGHYSVNIFNTNASGAAGNITLSFEGFAKALGSLDVLKKVNKGYTNEVPETTSTATVAGYGDIGGVFVTNAVGASNSISLPSTEYYGTNTAGSNVVSGSITNPIPVVVEGTVTVGPPKNLAQ